MLRTLLKHLVRGANCQPASVWGGAAAFDADDVTSDDVQAASNVGKIAVTCFGIWAVFGFLIFGRSTHSVEAVALLSAVHVVFVSALIATRHLVSPTVVHTVMILWAIAVSCVADIASRFGTLSSSMLIVVPMLAGVVGGGRYTALATVAALIALASMAWLESRALHGPLDFSPAQLQVTNTSTFLFANALSAWLCFYLLKRIEHMERDSTEWGLMLARDICTPMHGLLGLLDGLGDAKFGEAEKEILETLSGSSRMMLAIVDTMLSSAAFKGGSREQTVVPSDLLSIQYFAQAMARKRSQTVSVELQSRGPPCAAIRLALSDFLQVLGNLLSNAVKFSPRGTHISVLLTTELNDDQRTCSLTAEVVDSGPGVPLHLRRAIFTAFERGKHRHTAEGFGLGLAIVADTVSRMCGTIECRDRRDDVPGASFVARFPLLPLATAVESPAEQAVHVSSASASAIAMAIGRILVVDDNALNLLLVKRFLQSLGVPHNDIVTATSGEEALATVESETTPFGAAILDMVLPGIDGVELASRLTILHRQRFPESPSLCLVGASSSLTTAVQQSWQRAGVFFQVAKPFQRPAVLEMLTFVRSQRQMFSRNILMSGWSIENEFAHAPLVRKTPSEAVRIELLSGLLSLLPIVGVLRVFPCFVSGSCRFPLQPVQVVRMLLTLSVMAMRFAVVRFPFAIRTLLLSALLTAVPFMISMTGCESYVSYGIIPVLAGLLYDSRAIPACFAVCVVIHLSLLLGKVLRLVPGSVCEPFSPNSRSQEQFDIAVTIVLSNVCILIYRSLVALVQEQRVRWVHTLSHDLRAPLHVMFASISTLEETERLPPHVCHAVRSMKTCANTLLAVTDTVLDMAVSTVPTRSLVRMEELVADVFNAASMVLEPDMICRIESHATPEAALLCNRSALTYALSLLAAAIPLLTVSRVKICFNVELDLVASSVVVTAEEAARPPSLSAVERDPSGIGDASVAMWGKNVGQSALVRIVRGILRGKVRFVVEDECPGDLVRWRLSIEVPVDLAGSQTYSTPELPSLPRRHRQVCVAIVDDSVLNLRVCKAMLRRCGFETVVDFESAVAAVSALDNGELDGVHVMLIDLNMPEMSGLDFASRVHSYFDRQTIPCPALIACTGDASVATRTDCLQVGMRQTLIKPFGREQLMAQISLALQLDRC